MQRSSERVQAFALGAVSAFALTAVGYYVASFWTRKQVSSPATLAEDDCHSLFYDVLPDDKKGEGFPELGTTSTATLDRLRTVHPEYARLPFHLYKQIVENIPIVCVDVMCRRQDGSLLLFYRRDKPAANIWWWPGGRMFRGETFYDCAVRKLRDETGCKTAEVTPKGVVTVWNTFFPDSHWDAERPAGREGTQTVNVVVICDIVWDTNALLNAVSSTSATEWAVQAHRWVSVQDAITPGKYDKYVSGNVKLAQAMGFL